MIQSFESRLVRVRRWILGFTAGLLVHIGAIYAALNPAAEEEPEQDLSGPIAIELAPLPVSPRAENLDLPIGPRAEETQASTATPTKAETAKEEEAPNLTTTPYEPDDPDLKFSKQVLKKETQETPSDDKTTEKVETQQAAMSTPVPETTAPPPSNAPPAPVAAAPQAGLDKTQRIALERWQRKIVVHLNKFKRYPAAARASRKEGNVVISFTIDRYGRVIRRDVLSGSGTVSLDKAALAILERAGPLPAPPDEIAGSTFDLSLPIEYRVKM